MAPSGHGEQRANIFISYSSLDSEWKEQLLRNLALVIKSEDIWDDGKIQGGDDWFQEIERALNRAQMAILLVSVNFLNSEFIRRKEVADLLQAQRRRGLRIVPILLTDCPYEHVSWIKDLQFPQKVDGKLRPVVHSKIDDAGIQENWAAIAREIRRLVDQRSAQLSGGGGNRLGGEFVRTFGDADFAEYASKKETYENSLLGTTDYAVFARTPAQGLLSELESLRQRDANLADAMRLCAIPRVFDETILCALRNGTQEDSASLLRELTRYRFVTPRRLGGFTFDAATRELLLQGWEKDGKDRLDKLRADLAEFYWKSYQEFLVASREGDPFVSADPNQLPDLATGRLPVAPLPEALHHQKSRSIDAAVAFFEEKFRECEDHQQLDACRALLVVARGELQSGSTGPTEGRARWLDYWEAHLQRQQGQFDSAIEILETLIERSDGDERLKIWSLGELGDILFDLERIDEARPRFEEGLSLAQASRSDDINLPLWYTRVAEVNALQDDLEAASAGYRKSAELARQVQNHKVEADAWIVLSEVQQQRGRWAESWEAAIESLHLARTVLVQDRTYQVRVLRRMMELPSARAPELIESLFSECEALTVDADSLVELRLLHLACLRKSGSLQRADEQLEELLKEHTLRSNLKAMRNLTLLGASLRADEGQLEEAVARYRTVLRNWQDDDGEKFEKAELLTSLASVLAAIGRESESQSCARDAQAIWEKLGFEKRAAAAKMYVACGIVGAAAQAQTLLSDARKTLSGAEYLLADFHQVQGRVYRRQGRQAEASEQYQRSLILNRALDNYKNAARNLEDLLALDADDDELAARWTSEAAALKADATRANAWRPTGAEKDANRENARGVQSLSMTEGDRRENFARARSAFLAASQRASSCWYDLNLAYACRELGEWAEAAAAVESSLQKGADWWKIPRLQGLLQECRTKHVEALLEIGDRHWQSRAENDAQRAYHDALGAVERLEKDWQRQADVHMRLAVVCTLGGDVADGTDHFTAAIQCRRNDRSVDAAASVGESCGNSLMRDLNDFRALDLAWKSIGERSEPERVEDLAAARRGLVRYFENLFQFADAGERDPFLPLRLTLGERLIPEDTSTERWSLFSTLIPDIRSRVESDTGVKIPAVEVIGGLPAGNYAIEINEAWVARGAAEVDARFCPAIRSAFAVAGIPELALDHPAAHPMTGEPGHWLIEKYWKPAEGAGLELWKPLTFVMKHVEAMVRRHLAEFLDIQLAHGLLTHWTQATAARPSHDEGTANGRVLKTLLPLLRALIQERVPVTSGDVILKAIQSKDASRFTARVLRDVRRDLRRLLPGNQRSDQKLPLPKDWEQTLAAAYRDESGVAQLALTPERAHRFLSDVRETARPGPGVVLVVNRAELRPFVRQLVQGEFPDLMVLAADEQLPPAAEPAANGPGVAPVEAQAGSKP